MKLKGQIALVTGSSRGIGHAIVLLFAKEGARVVVNYSTSKDEADKVVVEIEKIGAEAVAIKSDVSNEDQVKAMIKAVVNRFGTIDILVNNAGIVFNTHFSKRTVPNGIGH